MNKPARRTSTIPESEPPQHILVIDDEAPIRQVLEACLAKHGYTVTAIASGEEALRLANKLPVNLIILDLVLEDADGLDLLQKFKAARPTRPVIIITGMGPDEDLARRASERGAADFISKTSPLDQLLETIEGALHPKEEIPTLSVEEQEQEKRQTRRKEWAEFVALAGAAAGDSTAAPAEAADAAAAAAPRPEAIWVAPLMTVTPESERFDFGMEVFSKMLSAYHPNLGNTALRAVACSSTLGEALGLAASQRQNLLWAAALHDISLVRIDRSTVNRWLRDPGKSTEQELILIQRHPEQSQRMLQFCPALKEAGELIVTHHEHWDGTGYPAGLKMEMIPWLSRLLAVVIYYCSKASPDAQTVKEIKAQTERMFDPNAVEAFLQALPHFTIPRGRREIMAFEVKTGMILAADIVDLDGMLILGEGTALTNAIVNKIAQISRAGEIEPHVLIYG